MPLLKSPFSLSGKSWGAAASRRRPGSGSSPSAGREKGRCPPHLWPVLANAVVKFSPRNGKAVYPSFPCSPAFIHGLYSWYLRNIIPISVLEAKVATGTGSLIVSSGAGVVQIFQKSPALSSGTSIQDHISLSPGSSAQSTFRVSRVRLHAKRVWLFY